MADITFVTRAVPCHVRRPVMPFKLALGYDAVGISFAYRTVDGRSVDAGGVGTGVSL